MQTNDEEKKTCDEIENDEQKRQTSTEPDINLYCGKEIKSNNNEKNIDKARKSKKNRKILGMKNDGFSFFVNAFRRIRNESGRIMENEQMKLAIIVVFSSVFFFYL